MGHAAMCTWESTVLGLVVDVFGSRFEVCLLLKTDRISFHEGVHVLPAVQLSNLSDISIKDGLIGISSPPRQRRASQHVLV